MVPERSALSVDSGLRGDAFWLKPLAYGINGFGEPGGTVLSPSSECLNRFSTQGEV